MVDDSSSDDTDSEEAAALQVDADEATYNHYRLLSGDEEPEDSVDGSAREQRERSASEITVRGQLCPEDRFSDVPRIVFLSSDEHQQEAGQTHLNQTEDGVNGQKSDSSS